MSDVNYPKVRLLIGGEWTDGTSGKAQEILNPATGQKIGDVPHASIPTRQGESFEKNGRTCDRRSALRTTTLPVASTP